ncbi:hypothetical protein GQ600_13910 [Phytophthora cactorum]|nr:hypothetical protein GQ600_13910 [Phytophthora cactorum]
MLSESMKASNLTKSQLTSCNVCNMAAPRKTRVRERLCRDKAKCRYKTQEYQTLNLVNVSIRGDHLTQRRGAEPSRMMTAMKEFATDLAAQGLTPSRICIGLVSRFFLDQDIMYSLQMVQRFVNYYTRFNSKQCLYIDDAKTIFFWGTPVSPMMKQMTLPSCLRGGNRRTESRGSDEERTKTPKAARDPSSFIMHMDATFKLSQANTHGTSRNEVKRVVGEAWTRGELAANELGKELRTNPTTRRQIRLETKLVRDPTVK